MDIIGLIVVGLLGLIIGGGAIWFYANGKTNARRLAAEEESNRVLADARDRARQIEDEANATSMEVEREANKMVERRRKDIER